MMDQNLKNERINLLLKLLMALLFLTGAVTFSYPFVVDAINNYYDQKTIEKMHRENQEQLLTEREEHLSKMKQQNDVLRTNKQTTNIPGMGLVEDPFEESIGNTPNPDRQYFSDHTIGAIYIPKIHVSLPLFDETNSLLLEKGATVLQGTSLPIGGSDTHSVITGHSGLPNKLLFTDLEKLQQDDVFYLDVAGEKLAYQIEQFNTVLPHELEDLKIKEGKDLVTLVTCTPYMVNTHRLLVTAHRIPYIEEVMEKEKEQTEKYHYQRFWLFMLAIPVVLVSIAYWMWRKFVYYQSGKYRYDFQFIYLKNGEPLAGQRFILSKRHKQIAITTSNQDGKVCFSQIRGGCYWVTPANREQPKIKGYIFRLKEKQFVLRSRSIIRKNKRSDTTCYWIEEGKQK